MADATKINGYLLKDSTARNSIDGIVDGTTSVGKAETLSTERTIDGISFDGSAAISHYAECSTEASSLAKTVTIDGFKLEVGARVSVKWMITNTALNPTLNVNGTGAFALYAANTRLTTTALYANKIMDFIYDGTCYRYVGERDTDTKVSQYESSTLNNEYPLLSKHSTNTTTTYGDYTRFTPSVTLNPSTGALTANQFNGNASQASDYDPEGGTIMEEFESLATTIAEVNTTAEAANAKTLKASYDSDTQTLTLSIG